MSVDLEKIKKAKGRTYVIIDECEPISVDDYVACKRIEKEIGISLITLFKALRNGIYAKDGDSWLGTELHLSFKAKALFYEFDNGGEIHHEEWFYFKDYGKTWALTKEELTDEHHRV